MSVEMRAYDNEHGDPVVVMVTTGTYDVSRLVGLLASGRCEDQTLSERVRTAIHRHNGGRAALRLLRDHGGPDFTEQNGQGRVRSCGEWHPHSAVEHNRVNCWKRAQPPAGNAQEAQS